MTTNFSLGKMLITKEEIVAQAHKNKW